jgi:hypothetical protein
VKPVAQTSASANRRGRANAWSEIGLLAMKGCVEAGYLRNLRSNIHDCGNGRKVVRLMKRRQ